MEVPSFSGSELTMSRRQREAKNEGQKEKWTVQHTGTPKACWVEAAVTRGHMCDPIHMNTQKGRVQIGGQRLWAWKSWGNKR